MRHGQWRDRYECLATLSHFLRVCCQASGHENGDSVTSLPGDRLWLAAYRVLYSCLRRAMRYVPRTLFSGIISWRPPLTKGETRGPTTGRDFPMRRGSLQIQVTRDSELRFVVRRAQWTGLDSLRYRDGTAWRVTEFPDQVHAYGVHLCTALPYRLLCFVFAVPR